jgi:hypothetical protein
MPPRGRVSKTNRRRSGSYTCIRWSYTTSRNRSYDTAVPRHWVVERRVIQSEISLDRFGFGQHCPGETVELVPQLVDLLAEEALRQRLARGSG